MEEDDADETDCGGVKNRSLSESVSEDAWPIRESDGVETLSLMRLMSPRRKHHMGGVKSSPVSSARQAQSLLSRQALLSSSSPTL